MEVKRIIDLLPYQLKKHNQPDAIAYKEGGVWKKYSTQEVIDNAAKVSRALLQFGIRPGDMVALIANNRPEWNFVDIGVLNIGAVVVPIYPTISEGEYKFIFNDAEVKLAFVSDSGLYKKVSDIRGEVPSLQEIFTFDKIAGAKHFSEFLALDNNTNQLEVEALTGKVDAEQMATIIYTSGTTGTPKGVMLSHHNIISNILSVSDILPLESTHRALSFLPLCHIFERVVVYTYLYTGASIYYAESMETIGENIKEVKPHFFSSVPRLLEKVYDKIVGAGHSLTGIKKALFFWALDLGLQFDDQGNNSAIYNMKLAVARKLIFSKWQEALGGNLIGIVTGAAALQNRLSKVFSAAGIKVRQGYGQTETSPVLTVDKFEDGEYYLGTVGQVIPGVELKLDPKTGEILAKGPNIMMGYYKRPDLTAETIIDGWLHTGDVGTFIDGKYLKITDRVKELFKTSGGKYVAPQVIENKMKESPYIEQIMVIGENEKFVSALIVANFPAVKEWAKRHNVDASKNNEELLKDPAVQKLFKDEVEALNKDFSHVEQVKRFKVLVNEWSMEGGELTPTLKVKRKVVMEKYQKVVDEIYSVA
ncbi:AMP-dependent synthetase/ligase [soil metagenome]